MKITQSDIEAAHAETERLCHDLDITNADHIVLWLETNLAPGCGATLGYLACRIIEAHEQAIAAAEARGRKGIAKDCPVEYATVRDGGDEWHIECRFKDGQKFAAVRVDKDHEDLADWIAAIINAVGDNA